MRLCISVNCQIFLFHLPEFLVIDVIISNFNIKIRYMIENFSQAIYDYINIPDYRYLIKT